MPRAEHVSHASDALAARFGGGGAAASTARTLQQPAVEERLQPCGPRRRLVGRKSRLHIAHELVRVGIAQGRCVTWRLVWLCDGSG